MAQKRNRVAAWYAKAVSFNIETLFSRPRLPGPPRSIFVNQDLPNDYYDNKNKVKKDHIFSTNQVITSKYTIITFLPRNLLEQFRRVANIFFLAIAILQFFPIFPTVSPGLVILPLIIVIGVTSIKDAYEDIKRHQSDRAVNYSQVRVLAGATWLNPNPMRGKSKTFVPAMVPNFRAGKRKSSKSVLPEAFPDEQDPAIEYDETESPVEEGEGGLFGHHDKLTRAHWRKTIWEDVRVGDFVKIMDDEPFPADLLICATSEDENVAFVETKNLDGETNLKSKSANPALTHLRHARACANRNNAFRVDCDRPDTNLYKLNGAVVFPNGEKSSVDSQMVLLRGTVLRNTGWVIGVVLFTGQDAKIVMNSGGAPSKRSKVERQMNPQVFINLGILAVMAVVCGIVDAVLEQRYYPRQAPWLLFDDQNNDNPHINGLITWAFALITFQNIIPISLYISLEAVRSFQALFIYFDHEIYYKKTDQPTVARSWNLSDDLGQIEYIFSDKTGTLTQNVMVFRQCSVGGRAYRGDRASENEVIKVEDDLRPSSSASRSQSGKQDSPPPSESVLDPFSADAVKLSEHVLTHFHDTLLSADIATAVGSGLSDKNAAHARRLNGFFSTLALCHTALVTVDPETGALQYKAQSPDESALVQAAADVGFVFRKRDREILHLQTPFSDEPERYELLNILEFSSARRRMSVVVRKLDEEDSRLFLLTKGADNVIFERLGPGQEVIKRETEQHLGEFASDGLRTLTLAYKVIPEDFYEDWNKRILAATVSLDDREELIDAAYNDIELDLRLLGATAIEDRLQDGVPETIADLKEAGIKIWVATGDKLETAIAIGHSTNLITPDDNIIIIRAGATEDHKPIYTQMVNAVEGFFPDSGILDEPGVGVHDRTVTTPSGGAYPLHRLSTATTDLVGHNNGGRDGGYVLVIDGGALTDALGDERHKALLLGLAMQCEGVICCRVSPVQKAQIVRLVKDGLGAMTLAIGDGANDVSMIQAADVGVGISGEEGLQAVNSSDYAIAQFRFLKRLLFVHGHWSYARNGNMIVNFFYKNIICIGVLWWFMIYCAWSSQYAFEYTYLLFWNSFWTIAPVIAIGLFDRVVDDHILMTLPELYRHSRQGEYFNIRIFLVYMFDGVVQSAIIFFLIFYTYDSTTSRPDGFGVYQYEFAVTMAIATAFAANLFNGLNTAVWTGWVFFAVALGPALILIYTAFYSAISPGWFSTPIYGNNVYLWPSAYYWLGIFLATTLALMPRYIAKAYQFGFNTSDIDRVRWLHKLDPQRDFTADRAKGLSALGRTSSIYSRRRRSSLQHRPSLAPRPSNVSRTDMSTGMRSVSRGFDFAHEDNGVALQRMQSNLSERHQRAAPTKRRRSFIPSSLKNSLRRKKPPVQYPNPNWAASDPHPLLEEEPRESGGSEVLFIGPPVSRPDSRS